MELSQFAEGGSAVVMVVYQYVLVLGISIDNIVSFLTCLVFLGKKVAQSQLCHSY